MNGAQWRFKMQCQALGEIDKPWFVRTDNERCFTGKAFVRSLDTLGIHHQRIDLHYGRTGGLSGFSARSNHCCGSGRSTAAPLTLREFSD